MYVFKYEESPSVVSVEESSVARKRVWTYERPPGGTSAATRPLHAHRREAMEQIAYVYYWVYVYYYTQA